MGRNGSQVGRPDPRRAAPGLDTAYSGAMLTLLLTGVIGLMAEQPPLDQVAWLGGCWQSAAGPRVVTEMWMPADGGVMIGGGRTVVAGKARAFEHLRLRADGDALVYTAIPSGQRETDFRSTAVSATGFTVENLAHDFPQRIVYTRTGDAAFTARVEGPGPNGPRGFDLAFRRVPCESGTPPK